MQNIEVQVGGDTITFPEGTDPEVMRRVASQHHASLSGAISNLQAGMEGQTDAVNRETNAAPSMAQDFVRRMNEVPGQVLGAQVNEAKSIGRTLVAPIIHPIATSIPGQAYQGIKDALEHTDTPQTLSETRNKLGVDWEGAKQDYAAGNLPSAIQKVVDPAIQLLLLKKLGEMVPGAEGIKPKVPGEGLATDLVTGPQVRTMADAAKLHPDVVRGAEEIFRASAPTASNPGYRANVYAAAGDLAEVGRKIDLAESKGGVITPDMRVRATVQALNDHLGEMYQQERAPQIARHADAPVNVKLGADAEMGLQYLKRSAGAMPDVDASTLRTIAAKAIDTGAVSVAEADQLGRIANQHLKNFESMTPSEKLEVLSKTPKIAGLKALDVGLGKNLNSALAGAGEPGLRAYERRYAAVSEVRDQLQSRMNATELPRSIPGARLVRAVLGGKSGIASASQAAVADVNIGKQLQSGLKRLAGSDIQPERP